jgi:dTDP-4-dehydrorhamnose reductase
MNILVLGSSVMLGSMAVKFFSNSGSYTVHTFDKRFEAPFTDEYFSQLLDLIEIKEIDVLINAIGSIPQRHPRKEDLFAANTVLPIQLANRLPSHVVLVTPSTDCIYKGTNKNPYEDTDQFDDYEDYGLSKALAEMAVLIRNNSLVIRGSIVGRAPVKSSGQGLLDWFLSLPASEQVSGWTNHQWNGVTTLEWCNILHELLAQRITGGMYSVASENTISKYELLTLVKEVWGRETIITKTQHQKTLNKALNASLVRANIKNQLEELKRFLDD